MPKAYGALATEASSAADRLAAKNKPTGKQGSPALTVKMRSQFDSAAAEAQIDGRAIGWEEWLDQQGYGIGDNDHVYKK